MPDTAEEAAYLLRGPPSYDSSIVPPSNADQVAENAPHIEEFEISEPEPDGENTGSTSWFMRMTSFGKYRIYVPARHIIDPIAQLWHAVSLRTDTMLGRYINPLLAKRLIFVLFTSIIVGILYYSHADSMLGLDLVHYDHKQLRLVLQQYISKESLRETAEFFGQMPHYAGSVGDRTTAAYVHDTLQSLGMRTSYNRHDVFLSHGDYLHCELRQNGEVVWESDLVEGQALENPNPSQQQPRTQMALSLPGEAEGQLVYINFGSADDIAATGDTADKIAIVKFGHEDPGVVAMRAEQAGVKGLLFFSQKHPTEPMWPDGPDYPADAVQQGSLAFPAMYPGDILSPGWPSSMQMAADVKAAHIAHIPAAALSWNDAAPLLRALNGQGKSMLSNGWGNENVPTGVEWCTGPTENHTVRLVVRPEAEERHQITNVIAQMPGREAASRTIVIGTRLDAMCYGSTEMAGLAVLLEVARAFANLRYDKQWQPLRSIMFAAWDGTSHNYAGSTEWVESVADSLSTEGVAYIDLSLGVSGRNFVVEGNPLFELKEIMDLIECDGESLQSLSESDTYRPIRGFGNHIAFQSHTGVPSLQVGFHGSVAPLDSCYDSLEWMARYGDPNFERHRALADFVASLVLELADAPLVPFDMTKLGLSIASYVKDLKSAAQDVFGDDAVESGPFNDVLNEAISSSDAIIAAGAEYKQIRMSWEEFWNADADEANNLVGEAAPIAHVRLFWNEWIMHVNKAMLDRNGIAHRNWYKHHLFGPEFDYVHEPSDRYAGTFPAVRDGLAARSQEYFVDTLRDAVAHIKQAATTPVLK